ncbi:MAG: hypothetical protein Q8L29_03475 [archaeon]|nr:hypothetical protein [archaeon]
MVHRKGAWIEVWPLQGHNLGKIETSSDNELNRIKLNRELSEHVEKLWVPKSAKGWKSSWVPFIRRLSFDSNQTVSIHGGAMAFKEIDGINQAIENEMPIVSPDLSYNPCLSVGFLTATKDGKVIFQRRAQNVHCPNMLIHEPCGYMTSMAFAPRAECDKPEHATDSRLFDINAQLDDRKREIAETFGVPKELVSYHPEQDFLGCGWKTIETYFSTTGKIDADSRDLKLPEKQEVFFVPFEHLKELIYNQGRLSRVNPEGYRPSNYREIPLIDESLIGLVYGYERMTGDKLDIPQTIDRLNRDGLEIKVHDTSPGKSYDFPNSF